MPSIKDKQLIEKLSRTNSQPSEASEQRQHDFDLERYKTGLRKQFDGARKWLHPYKHRRPDRELNDDDVEHLVKYLAGQEGDKDLKGRSIYRNKWNELYAKYEDLDTYLSPTQAIPKRLIVQATSDVRQKANDDATWRRSKLQGDLPTALKLSEWAFQSNYAFIRYSKMMLVALPLQILLALPGLSAPWDQGEVDDLYSDYPGYHWSWPKHSINPLDRRGNDSRSKANPLSRKLSSKARLIRPRQLIVHHKGRWELDPNPDQGLQYAFMSWQWDAWITRDQDDNDDGRGQSRFHTMAENITLRSGLTAYWCDDCNAPKDQPDLLTSDIYRMSDVVRGSRFVALLLPDHAPQRLRDWGERIWCLPEGLLAPGDIQVYTWNGEGDYAHTAMGKVELTSQAWADEADQEEAPSRVLAEHFAGNIMLSRLELFSCAVEAFSVRKTGNNHTGADEGYAIMGLLNHRIEPDVSDDLFQVIARLSLTNDSDRLIERMISMFPKQAKTTKDFFRTLAEKDQYETHFWDIIPRCEIVGVGEEPNTIIINDARAVPIRWKQFPRIKYKAHEGMRHSFFETLVCSGAWWFAAGINLVVIYAPQFAYLEEDNTDPKGQNLLQDALIALVLTCFAISIILSCFAPAAVHRLFGGEVLESSPHLVGFEGTLPISSLERIVFGNNRSRLKYEPSSTPYSREYRDPLIRIGAEPRWITDNRPEDATPTPPPGHRLFTLVDTGNLSVSVFSARRPPTTAVICGSEGGMLRAVLCSWRFANDCLYRETVARMQSATWEMTKPAGWLKVCLESQGDIFEMEGRARVGRGN